MKGLFNILVFLFLSLTTLAQENTFIVDSLSNVLLTQQGREKVLTMIELTWEFYDISYDDCLDWGEKAINEAHNQGFSDLEAKANYVLGLQYAYHGDLDLAKDYFYKSYYQYIALDDTENAFESLWDIATYELTLGNIDTAYQVYEKALEIAEDDYYSGYAYIKSNMALICQQKNQLQKAIDLYLESKRVFELIDDKRMSTRIDFELAMVYYDLGDIIHAKRVFTEVIPKLEEFEDYYPLVIVSKNMGIIFENNFVNYDSALFYLNKAMDYSKMPIPNKERQVLINNEKSNVISEIANIMVCQGDYKGAIEQYEEALYLSEKNSYLHGQQTACQALGKVYSQLGQASKSLDYYKRYMQLEKASGILNMRSQIRVPLVMDYARLDMFEEMQKELESYEEEYAALIRENTDVYEQNRNLKYDAENLLHQHESQNVQIQTLQSQRNHYRLAFFGLLAIMLSALVLFVAYKIVRKNRTKNEKG